MGRGMEGCFLLFKRLGKRSIGSREGNACWKVEGNAGDRVSLTEVGENKAGNRNAFSSVAPNYLILYSCQR